MRYTRTVRHLLGAGVLATSTVWLGAASSAAPNHPQGIGSVTVPGTIVVECFGVERGADPNVPVRALTKNFGFDTLIVRRVDKMCEPALKLPDDPAIGNPLVVMEPNASLMLSAGAGNDTFTLDGAIALIRESPSLPSKGKVVASSMQGGELAGSFFDVFTELDGLGDFEMDNFFDITYRFDVQGTETTSHLHLLSQGGGVYTGDLSQPVQIGGVTMTTATLTLNDPADPKAPSATRVMECFRIQRGTNPDDPYALVTKNFGTDKVIVRNAEHLCEGALKTKQPILPGTVLPVKPPDLAWQCFALQLGDNPGKFFRVYTQNFGAHRVRVVKAVQLCEDARKDRVDAAGVVTSVGQATGRVWECYATQDRNPNAVFWLTNVNFGGAPALVRNGVAMCERAEKIPLPGFPTGAAGDN